MAITNRMTSCCMRSMSLQTVVLLLVLRWFMMLQLWEDHRNVPTYLVSSEVIENRATQWSGNYSSLRTPISESQVEKRVIKSRTLLNPPGNIVSMSTLQIAMLRQRQMVRFAIGVKPYFLTERSDCSNFF